MSQIAVTCLDASVHTCWEDAVQHVAIEASTSRERLWFVERRDGAFFFDTPFQQPGQPIAWITNRIRYQVAKSRGDLEDLPTFF